MEMAANTVKSTVTFDPSAIAALLRILYDMSGPAMALSWKPPQNTPALRPRVASVDHSVRADPWATHSIAAPKPISTDATRMAAGFSNARDAMYRTYIADPRTKAPRSPITSQMNGAATSEASYAAYTTTRLWKPRFPGKSELT